MLPRAGLRTLLGARHRVVRGAPSPRATLHPRRGRRAARPRRTTVLSSKAKEIITKCSACRGRQRREIKKAYRKLAKEHHPAPAAAAPSRRLGSVRGAERHGKAPGLRRAATRPRI